MSGPQHTSCVQPEKFKPLNKAYLVTLGILTLLPLMLFSLVEGLRYVLDWMVNGKLICLKRNNPNCNCGDSSGQVCAIGAIVDVEEVGEDKNPIEDVDNDYSINLMLLPSSHRNFASNGTNLKTNIGLAENAPQGDLLKEQPGMPDFSSYAREMIMYMKTGEYETKASRDKIIARSARQNTSTTKKEYMKSHNISKSELSQLLWKKYNSDFNNLLQELYQQEHKRLWEKHINDNKNKDPQFYKVPVFHCEFEGSRMSDLLDVINFFTFGGKWCKKNWFFRLLCITLQAIFSPFILPALFVAWATAKDGDYRDALTDPNSGEIKERDTVIVRGRWAYDGGHDGWNEMHAVRTLQKIQQMPTNKTAFVKDMKKWCNLLAQTPLGSASSPLRAGAPEQPTPKQQETIDRQNLPVNQWTIHPYIDGCSPDVPIIN